MSIFPECSNLAVLRSRTRVALFFLISSRRRIYEKDEEAVFSFLSFHSTVFCHSEFSSESSFFVFSSVSFFFCHSGIIFSSFIFSSDTISGVLFVEKVPKLLGREKLGSSAHPDSCSHLIQTVPLPKPR